jgi:hypothetical protein
MKGGIYRIVNLKNGDSYIGSSNNLLRRNKEHWRLCKSGSNHSILLQKAWNKYGEESFKFEILARCPIEYLFKLEQWFVDNLNPKYNICKQDVSVPIGLKHCGYYDKNKYKEIANIRLKLIPTFGWPSRIILKLDDNNDVLKEYSSLKEYAVEHNCSIGNVGKALKKGTRCKGFYIKYKE